MKTKRIIPAILVLMTMVMMFQSCDNDNDEVWYYPSYPNALVTIKPIEGGAFYMQVKKCHQFQMTGCRRWHPNTKKIIIASCFCL